MPEQEYLIVDHLSLKEIARIFSKIKVNPITGCWLWTAGLDPYYGLVYYKGRKEKAHRLLYAWAVEPVPRGVEARRLRQLDHVICKAKRCCNPSHLEMVTQRTNVLRGISPPAVNITKTHCPKGHPFTPTPRGERVCRICDNERHKKRMEGPDREYWLLKNLETQKRHYLRTGGVRQRETRKARRNGPDREEILRKDREYQRRRKHRAKDETLSE